MKGAPEALLEPRILLALICLLTLAVAPHVRHLSPWVSGVFLCLVALRLLALRRASALPGRWLLLLLTLGTTANVLLHTSSLLSRDAGVALMTSMLGLKLMELRTGRDVYVTVFLGYFLVVTNALYDQGLVLVAYLFAVTAGFTAVLVEINRASSTPQPWRSLRQAAAMLLQASPLMLVAFLLFPRLPGPLWGIAAPADGAVTGLSDRLDPGSISRLIQSGEPAFRVEFADREPPPERRYWRGPVLWDTDGRQWSTGEPRWPKGGAIRFQHSGLAVRYTVTLEPNEQRWLFALDLPAEVPQDSKVSTDFQLVSNRKLDARRRYTLTSYPEYATGALDPDSRARGLALPDNVTDRTRRLVVGWRRQTLDDRQLVQRALDFFRNQPFVYTLSPPALGTNPTDAFLFETRRGFCEHYASSFTLLMRLAGIPARVVTGYQGGEYNPLGDYYLIRQSDAHAWAEVWLTERGWVRVDPTAAVAPERVERAIDPTASLAGAAVRFYVQAPDLVGHALRQIRFGWDSVNSSWHRWVLGYTDQRQRGMLHDLGLGFLRGRGLGIGMVAVSAVVLVLVAFGMTRNARPRLDPAQAAYLRYCRILAKRGLPRGRAEGPKDFGRRVAESRPALRAVVDQITESYIALRYGAGGSHSTLASLRRQIWRLRLADYRRAWPISPAQHRVKPR